MCNEKENLMERMMILDSSKIVSIIGAIHTHIHLFGTKKWKNGFFSLQFEEWLSQKPVRLSYIVYIL